MINYSSLHQGRTIIHVVGGKMNEDLADNIGQIAQWFVDNDITLLWGDDYQAEFDKTHPVKILADEIVQRGGNKPIRVLQLGEDDYNQIIASHAEAGFPCDDVLDDNDDCIGIYDRHVKNELLIYTDKQQYRQMLYYNNADALMVLNGGIGAAYEIPNSIIYGFSGDVASHFKTIIIDNPENQKFKHLIDAYLSAGDLTVDNMPQIKYYSSAKHFVESVKDEIISKGDDELE